MLTTKWYEEQFCFNFPGTHVIVIIPNEVIHKHLTLTRVNKLDKYLNKYRLWESGISASYLIYPW